MVFVLPHKARIIITHCIARSLFFISLTNIFQVPQTQDDLFSLHTVSDSYNYGSGVPTSPPPSFHSSANIRPSIPSSNSAPGPNTPATTGTGYTPSFRTARHPLTSQNLAALPENDETPPYSRGDVAETLVDGQTIADGVTVNGDGENAIILNLHKRISQLETSMGCLLLQNDELRLAFTDAEGQKGSKGTNCCITLWDDDEDLRRMLGKRDNCCVAIGGKRRDRSQRAEEWTIVAWIIMVILGFVLGVIMVSLIFGRKDNSYKNYNPGESH